MPLMDELEQMGSQSQQEQQETAGPLGLMDELDQKFSGQAAPIATDEDGYANVPNPFNDKKPFTIAVKNKDGSVRTPEEMEYYTEKAKNQWLATNGYQYAPGMEEVVPIKKMSASGGEVFGRSFGDSAIDTVARLGRFVPRGLSEAEARIAGATGIMDKADVKDYLSSKSAAERGYNSAVNQGLYSTTGELTSGYNKETSEANHRFAAAGGHLAGTVADAAGQAVLLGGLGKGGTSFKTGGTGPGYLEQFGKFAGDKAGAALANSPRLAKAASGATNLATVNTLEALPFNTAAGASDVAYDNQGAFDSAAHYGGLSAQDAGFGAVMGSGKIGKAVGLGTIGALLAKAGYDAYTGQPHQVIDEP